MSPLPDDGTRPPWIPADVPWPPPEDEHGSYRPPVRYLAPPAVQRHGQTALKAAAGREGISGATEPLRPSEPLERADSGTSGLSVETRCTYECGVEDGVGHAPACRRAYSVPEGGRYIVPVDVEIPEGFLPKIAEILRQPLPKTWSAGGAIGRALAELGRPLGSHAGYNPDVVAENLEILQREVENTNFSARPSWDTWALGLAEAVATRADCTRRHVGAVILDAEHRVVSTGYNGYPSGMPGCATAGACPRGQRSHAEIAPDSPYVGGDAGRCDALHAEENAVLWARRDLRGCTVYVTHEPCPNCARFLAGTGIARVVWPGGERSL